MHVHTQDNQCVCTMCDILTLRSRDRGAISTGRSTFHILIEKYNVKVSEGIRSSQVIFVSKKWAGRSYWGVKPRGGKRRRSQRGSADKTGGTFGTRRELKSGCYLVPDVVERSGGLGFGRW